MKTSSVKANVSFLLVTQMMLQPVTSLWWGKLHVVSICSPQLFKETVRLVNRPRELKVFIFCTNSKGYTSSELIVTHQLN